MVWFIAFLCLGLVGAAGYYQGPVRAAFAFLGLLFGTFLAGPLSPLTKHLLPLIGLHHPAWTIFAPQVLAFLVVLTIFKIGGQVVHQKIAVFFKYKVDDKTMYRWVRVYSRVGFCVGLLNGVFYFVLLMLLIYSAGYFTTLSASGEADPAGVKFLTETRAQLHAQNLDKVLATYDMVPAQVYKAADIAALILHNPLLLSRLGHYPPCLQLAERPDFKDLSRDVTLQQMIATQTKIGDIIRYPKIQAMLTNGTVVSEVGGLMAKDLDDLQTYLTTGQSPIFDPETILGIWNIDRVATIAQIRIRQPRTTPKELTQKKDELFPLSSGLSLTAMPNFQIILKQPNPDNGEITIVAVGTWKKEQETYTVNLPGSQPEDFEIAFDDNRLQMPKRVKSTTYTLVFDKE